MTMVLLLIHLISLTICNKSTSWPLFSSSVLVASHTHIFFRMNTRTVTRSESIPGAILPSLLRQTNKSLLSLVGPRRSSKMSSVLPPRRCDPHTVILSLFFFFFYRFIQWVDGQLHSAIVCVPFARPWISPQSYGLVSPHLPLSILAVSIY